MHKLRLKSRGFHRVHLRDRLILAQELGGKEDVNGVGQVIQHKEIIRMWYLINPFTYDPKSGGIRRVGKHIKT